MRLFLPCLVAVFAISAAENLQAQITNSNGWVYELGYQNQYVTVSGFTGTIGSGGVVNIPATIDGFPVQYVGGNYAIFGTNNTTVTKVTIPEGVSSVDGYAFWKCLNLTSVVFPQSLSSIGSYAFADCSNLVSAPLPDGVVGLFPRAFANCRLTNLVLPTALTNVDTEVFINNRLTNITFGPNVKQLGTNCFTGNPFKRIVIPDSVEIIRERAFFGCQWATNVTIGTGVLRIESRAFNGVGTAVLWDGWNSGITNVAIPFVLAGRISIAADAFDFPSNAITYDFGTLANMNSFIDALAQNPAFVAAVAERLKAGTNSYGLATKEDLVITASNTMSQIQADPNAYSLYSESQYSESYGSGIVTGTSMVTSNPEAYNLYTTNSIMDLAVGGLMVQKTGGVAELTFQTQTTPDLSLPFTNNGPPLTNVVTMPGNKGFLRVQATTGQ